eukprot:TRINITY_DN4149_c0_g2_i1.p1 TRINITY_DN4149_c0_g2~~TRINITY_DN4149_c0_g2_i1.p1  ORF type:complete len:330 (+),score=67.25 TRINITY_DN4149_c0_g2_i1:514-1503(+)
MTCQKGRLSDKARKKDTSTTIDRGSTKIRTALTTKELCHAYIRFELGVDFTGEILGYKIVEINNNHNNDGHLADHFIRPMVECHMKNTPELTRQAQLAQDAGNKTHLVRHATRLNGERLGLDTQKRVLDGALEPQLCQTKICSIEKATQFGARAQVELSDPTATTATTATPATATVGEINTLSPEWLQHQLRQPEYQGTQGRLALIQSFTKTIFQESAISAEGVEWCFHLAKQNWTAFQAWKHQHGGCVPGAERVRSTKRFKAAHESSRKRKRSDTDEDDDPESSAKVEEVIVEQQGIVMPSQGPGPNHPGRIQLASERPVPVANAPST